MLSSNINKIDFSMLEPQVEIILRALELYAYNIHYSFSPSEEFEHLNTMLFHTYEGLLSSYSKQQYRIGYNVSYECSLRSSRIKKYNYYNKRKKVA